MLALVLLSAPSAGANPAPATSTRSTRGWVAQLAEASRVTLRFSLQTEHRTVSQIESRETDRRDVGSNPTRCSYGTTLSSGSLTARTRRIQSQSRVKRILLTPTNWCNHEPPALGYWAGGVFTGVEQLVARLAHNQEIAGSNPAPGTRHGGPPASASSGLPAGRCLCNSRREPSIVPASFFRTYKEIER